MHPTTSPMLLARATALLGVLFAAPPMARGAPMIYTFEAPQFTMEETTPLLDRAPNTGDAMFRTDFTASGAGFHVRPAEPNPLFSGLALVDPAIGETLTLVFSHAVFSVRVDFAVNAVQETPAFLQLITTVGSTSHAATNVGGVFPGGTLVFESAVGFTTVALLGFRAPTTPTEFAIDNLRVDTTPTVAEPTSLILIGTGLAGMVLRRFGGVRWARQRDLS